MWRHFLNVNQVQLNYSFEEFWMVFNSFHQELKQKKREEFKNIAVFPCKLRIMPQHIFNSRGPIVVGVVVEAGVVKEGTPVTVPSKEVSVI